MEKYSFILLPQTALRALDYGFSLVSQVKGKGNIFLFDASFPMFFWGREGMSRNPLILSYLRSF